VKRRRRILLIAGAVVALALAVLLRPRESEPVYQGKTLSEWLKIYNDPEDPTAYNLFPRSPRPILAEFYDAHDTNYGAEYAQREWAELARRRDEAAKAVRHIGTNALPHLLRWLDQDLPVPWKAKVAAVRHKLPGMFRGGRLVNWWLNARGYNLLTLADCGFELLGSNASPAVPELTRRMNTRNSTSGAFAIAALGLIGTNGLAPMLTALTNAQSPNRAAIVRSLKDPVKIMGTNAGPAIEVLARCVGDKDIVVATLSVDTLRSSAGRSAVPALTALLNAPDPYVRNCATNALYQIEPER
jgi:hypothetical protein